MIRDPERAQAVRGRALELDLFFLLLLCFMALANRAVEPPRIPTVEPAERVDEAPESLPVFVRGERAQIGDLRAAAVSISELAEALRSSLRGNREARIVLVTEPKASAEDIVKLLRSLHGISDYPPALETIGQSRGFPAPSRAQ